MTTPNQEHLWEMLLHQARISALTHSITTILIILLIWVCYKFIIKKVTAPPETEENPITVPEWGESGAGTAWVIFTVFSAIAVVVLFFSIHEIFTCLLHPEYWATVKLNKL